MRISDWSSDVCSSDLVAGDHVVAGMVKIAVRQAADLLGAVAVDLVVAGAAVHGIVALAADHVVAARAAVDVVVTGLAEPEVVVVADHRIVFPLGRALRALPAVRSQERRAGKEWVRTFTLR